MQSSSKLSFRLAGQILYPLRNYSPFVSFLSRYSRSERTHHGCCVGLFQELRPRNTLGVVAVIPRVHDVDINFCKHLLKSKSCSRIELPYLFCLSTILKLAPYSRQDLAWSKKPYRASLISFMPSFICCDTCDTYDTNTRDLTSAT